MFRTIYLMLQLCSLVYAHPLSCKEDVHCSDNSYCNLQEHVCEPCLKCEDFNRFAPNQRDDTLDSCIKSVQACGPCFEGYINIYVHIKAPCASPELLHFEDNNSYCIYIWMAAAVIGSGLVITFIYVIENTAVFQIVPNYDPVSTTSDNEYEYINETTKFVEAPSNNIAKRVLLLFMNLKRQQK